MLRPSKHSHPDQTVVSLALLLLRRLRDRRVDEYGDLLTFAKNAVGGAEFLFMPALNLLFLLGLVEYRRKSDALEYVGPNETQ